MPRMSPTPTLYCAPCTSDLALVREAVTFVSGTASCAAHAVLLTHPHDNPGRRRARLNQLRQLAESKAATAAPEEQAALELLVHEYTLAGAMDMSGQPRPDGSPRRDRSERTPGQGGAERAPGTPSEPGEGRNKRGRRGRDRDRPREDREPGALPEGSDAPAPSAPADSALPAGTSADGAPAPTADGTPATSAPAESAPAPAAPAPAPAESAPAPAESAPASSESAAAPTPPVDAPTPPSMPEVVPAAAPTDGPDSSE